MRTVSHVTACLLLVAITTTTSVYHAVHEAPIWAHTDCLFSADWHAIRVCLLDELNCERSPPITLCS